MHVHDPGGSNAARTLLAIWRVLSLDAKLGTRHTTAAVDRADHDGSVDTLEVIAAVTEHTTGCCGTRRTSSNCDWPQFCSAVSGNLQGSNGLPVPSCPFGLVLTSVSTSKSMSPSKTAVACLDDLPSRQTMPRFGSV